MLDMVKHGDREREREEADVFPLWEEREENGKRTIRTA